MDAILGTLAGQVNERSASTPPSSTVAALLVRFARCYAANHPSGSSSAVEHQLPKLRVAGSIPVSRSNFSSACYPKSLSECRGLPAAGRVRSPSPAPKYAGSLRLNSGQAIPVSRSISSQNIRGKKMPGLCHQLEERRQSGRILADARRYLPWASSGIIK